MIVCLPGVVQGDADITLASSAVVILYVADVSHQAADRLGASGMSAACSKDILSHTVARDSCCIVKYGGHSLGQVAGWQGSRSAGRT